MKSRSRSRSRLDLWKIIYNLRNNIYLCVFKIQNMQVIQMMSSNIAKWCHQMLHCCIATTVVLSTRASNLWRSRPSRRNFFLIYAKYWKTLISYSTYWNNKADVSQNITTSSTWVDKFHILELELSEKAVSNNSQEHKEVVSSFILSIDCSIL